MAKHDEFTEKMIELLAKRFKSLRKAKGYSNYEHFAFRNEINRAQYGRYEKGADLRFSSLVKVLRALDINISEFFSEGFEEVEKEEKSVKLNKKSK